MIHHKVTHTTPNHMAHSSKPNIKSLSQVGLSPHDSSGSHSPHDHMMHINGLANELLVKLHLTRCYDEVTQSPLDQMATTWSLWQSHFCPRNSTNGRSARGQPIVMCILRHCFYPKSDLDQSNFFEILDLKPLKWSNLPSSTRPRVSLLHIHILLFWLS